MKLHIFSRSDAVSFQPEQRTYAIRIFSSWNLPIERNPLRESPLYLSVREYVFDDNDDFYQAGPRTIDDTIAAEIVDDFAKGRGEAECLLVHCGRGINRAPAVALALNDIFHLGHDSRWLRDKYKVSNQYVYQALIEAAGRRS
mgnify:CR=1 FL=1